MNLVNGKPLHRKTLNYINNKAGGQQELCVDSIVKEKDYYEFDHCLIKNLCQSIFAYTVKLND